MSKKIKTKSKLPKVDKTIHEAAKKAQSKLEAYFKENKLDPTKDWTKDKKHGKKVRELVQEVNLVSDKIKKNAPEEIHHKKSEDKKEKKPRESAPVKYDYPKIDGREMTSEEKKKYRSKMRKGETTGSGKKENSDKKSPAKDTGKKASATIGKSASGKKAEKPSKPSKPEPVSAKKKDKKKVKARGED